MNTELHFSSGKDDWQTPQVVLEPLQAEFGFGIDLAADNDSSVVAQWFGPGGIGEDALTEPWHTRRGPGWCNPPYSRGKQARFIAKAAEERQRGFTTVMLLPARPDTKAFHQYIYDADRKTWRDGIEVRFVKGRIRFVGAKHSAPFPSMVVIFHGAKQGMSEAEREYKAAWLAYEKRIQAERSSVVK